LFSLTITKSRASANFKRKEKFMNHLCMSAVFQEEPEGVTRQLVISEIRSLLKLFAPNAEVEIECGRGSWWVHAVAGVLQVAGTWLVLETLSWGMAKLLDTYCDQPKLDSGTQSIARPVPPFSTPGLSTKDEEVAERMRALAETLRSIFEKTGATAVTFSEWSDEAGMGRIIDLMHGPSGTLFSFHQTDSREEFNIRTNPTLRSK
jgi:hypothetical protein